MSKYYNDVKLFHDKFGLVTPTAYYQIPTDLYEFRVKFFHEEMTEYVEAFETHDLPTAIDSLIDLVYITCGCALLHGIDETVLDGPRDGCLCYCSTVWEKPVPSFLELEEHYKLKRALNSAIEAYRAAYTRDDQHGVENALNDLYCSCFYGAIGMGFKEERWDVLWDDVQRANMAKERVLKAEDSKRGSTWDVRKPTGWVPPRTEFLVNEMIEGRL